MNRNERRKLAKEQKQQLLAIPFAKQQEIATSFEHAKELFDQQAFQEAADICNSILKSNPRESETLHLLGIICLMSEQFENAERLLLKATSAKTDFAEAYFNLGIVLAKQRKLKEAEKAYRKAIKHDPQNVDFVNNLANLLSNAGNNNEAVTLFKKALNISPNHVNILTNYSATLNAQGEFEAAIDTGLKAITIQPDFTDAYNNLGNAYLSAGKLSEAIINLKKAVELQPLNARAHNNLGNALLDTGCPEDAIKSYKKALSLDPSHLRTHSNFIYCYQYLSTGNFSELNQYLQDWNQRHGQTGIFSSQKFIDNKNSRQRLRLGFVSSDLRRHPVGYFLIGVLENLSSDQFEIFCYADHHEGDDLTKRFERASDRWTNCYNNTNFQLDSKIRQDKVDILFELSGHTKGNRLALFALKPSPIQISWGIGYPGSTGLSTIDYMLTDRSHVTPLEDNYYRENILRMADGVSVYEAPDYAPAVSELPLDSNGYITFGSLNQPRKINQQVLNIWVTLLVSVPESKLLLKYTSMDDPSTISRIEEVFTSRDIEPARLIVEGGEPHAEFLGRYSAIDIALDTFPYSGGITSCEAMWMGVPVITFTGTLIASRHATSHLTCVGLTEFIAADEESYIETAQQLANDPDKLRNIRSNLRTRMASSPLCDGPRFVEHFSQQMREIWVRSEESRP
jgi:protein O-GlcNAc transferase